MCHAWPGRMTWALGDSLIGAAESLMLAYAQRGSEVWKQGKQPFPFPTPFGDACRALPEVRQAYEQRDMKLLYTRLLAAMSGLRRLRAVGRAMIFLEWRLALPPRAAIPLQQLWDDAAYVGISRPTLDRAKQRLPVQAIRKGGLGANGKWYWQWQSKSAAEQWLEAKEQAEIQTRQQRAARAQQELPLDPG